MLMGFHSKSRVSTSSMLPVAGLRGSRSKSVTSNEARSTSSPRRSMLVRAGRSCSRTLAQVVSDFLHEQEQLGRLVYERVAQPDGPAVTRCRAAGAIGAGV